MGVDFLDIHFRLENKFKIKIDNDLVRFAESRGITDLKVRDIIEFMQSRVPRVDLRAGVSGDRPCVICSYNLRGLSVFGQCPECGAAAGHYGQIHAGVCQTLVEAIGVKPDEITLNATLKGDLGMQ